MSVEKTKKPKKRVSQMVCEALDIMPDAMANTGTVEIRGRYSVYVREGGRILSYLPDSITVELNGTSVTVAGRELVCSGYCKGPVRVDGIIDSVSFADRRDRK